MEFKGDLKDYLESKKEELLSMLTSNKEELGILLTNNHITYADFVRPFMEFSAGVSDLFTPISHLQYVKNNEDTQKVFTSCIPVLTAYSTELAHNKDVYEAYLYIKREEYDKLDIAQKKVIDDAIFAFELEGVALPDMDKARIKEINIRLSELSDSFSQNLLNATNAYSMTITDEKILGGMPQSDKDIAKSENGWVFTLQMPSYIAFMTYCTDRIKREEVYKAYSTRAPQNEDLIYEILALRKEKAAILGYDSYADLNLRTMSAPSVEEVLNFLKSLGSAGKPFALKDMEALKSYAIKDGLDKLESYDLQYYSEKLKKEAYSYDEEVLRPYFEQDRVIKGMFDIIEKLYGVTFKNIEAELWDSKAKLYEVVRKGKTIGRLYFDLEARSDKRGGAWMNDWHAHHKDAQNKEHLAEVFVVANFPVSSANTPSLLRHDDVTTLFHEMGHALHHLLSTVDEYSVSGVNGIDWDVVEFPSQFFENYAYAPEVLKMLGKHYITEESIPQELIDKIVAAKNFQAGMMLVRQLEFGLFDMLIHMKEMGSGEVQKILDEVRKEIAVVIPPSYNKFQHGFSHIFSGGYAAGYYSYKWAEMFSADAFWEFIEKGLLNKELAEKYRDTVLAYGASRKMIEIYHEFLNRDPDPKAILKISGML